MSNKQLSPIKYKTKGYKYLSKYKTLYYAGNINLINNICLTVVGSRKATEYGKRVVLDLCLNLQNYSVATVSGYVCGIDYSVFINSIKNNIPTILVLGYGFDYLDKPKFLRSYNKYSAKKDFSDICIFSQFENNQNATKWTFPARDNLLASLGILTLVVEASKKSGTFYTVKQAQKEGKIVLAVPGNIYNQQCVGTNNLLAGDSGLQALVYRNYKDILNNTSLEYTNDNHQQYNTLQDLSNTEKVIIRALSGDNQHFDTICKITKLAPQDLTHILTKLELKGLIKNTGGVYCRVA